MDSVTSNKNNSLFFQKYFDEDKKTYGFYKIEGIKPDEDSSWKKLNIDFSYDNKVIAISPVYSDALEFSEGLAAVKEDDKWGVINETDKIIVPFMYDFIGEAYPTGEGIAFREGLAPVKKSDLWGYIDKNGKLLIPHAFLDAKCFKEGIASVKFPGRNTWSLINRKGELIKHTNYQIIQPFFEGKAAALPPKAGWCFINENGEVVIEYRGKSIFHTGGFENAFSFSDGMALVQPKNKYFGYINHNGQLKIKDVFIEALGFSFDLAGVKQDNYWGFIDKNSKWIIKPQYDLVNSFFIPR